MCAKPFSIYFTVKQMKYTSQTMPANHHHQPQARPAVTGPRRRPPPLLPPQVTGSGRAVRRLSRVPTVTRGTCEQ